MFVFLELVKKWTPLKNLMKELSLPLLPFRSKKICKNLISLCCIYNPKKQIRHSKNVSPWQKEGWKKYGCGAYISKTEGGAYYQGGHVLKGYHVFLQTCYFCGNIVINYSYHYVYSKIILENDSCIINMCCIRFSYILRDCKFI